MSDPENPSDAIPRSRSGTTTPPAAKIAREFTLPIMFISTIVAITTALIMGKLSEVAFVGLLSTMAGVVGGRAKPEGVVGEQSLVKLMGRE